MSRILERINTNTSFFKPQGTYEDCVEIFDHETGECIYIQCSCAFNCMILALKDLGHKGNISIVHKRDELKSEVCYATYRLLEDGFVHKIKPSNMRCYGEREVA